MAWTQTYDPFGHWWLSTLCAALPIIVLFVLLAGLQVRPHLAALAGVATAMVVATTAFHMPVSLAAASFLYGVSFGLLKIVWIVVAAVFLYDVSVEAGKFEIMQRSIARITYDQRLQVLLVAFCFGAFIEGCAGFGSPVAIAGAFMIGLGFRPFHAAALNLIANTAPVAWGAIGIPVHTLAAVCGLPEPDLSAMIGRILPITAVIVPFWLVRAMVGWELTFEVLPAILVVGFSFGLTQFFWANHMDSNLVDITSGVVSMIVLVVFLRRERRFDEALQILRSLQPQYPHNVLFAMEEGNLLNAKGQPGDAAAVYRRVWQDGRNGRYAGLHYEVAATTLGDLLRSQKNYSAAAAAYEQVGDIQKPDPAIQQKAALSAGEMYDLLQKRDLALKKYAAVVEVNAHSPQADVARKRIKEPYKGS